MCGLSGFWSPRLPTLEGELRRHTQLMANALRHRGPDDAGVWVDETAGFSLGHRRLAIVDLSDAGHQPMRSACGRYVIAFNGEIYNHSAVREALQAEGAEPAWRGHSDTETLLAAMVHWGPQAALQRSVGMFAFALWDKERRMLTLARDRLGEKPLYYGWVDGAFLFASELKAFQAYPGFNARLCRAALQSFLRFGYVPAPRSTYEGIFKLEPGCVLTIEGSPPATPPNHPVQPGDSYGSLSVRRWWSLSETVAQESSRTLSNPDQAVDALESALTESIRLQMLADVPVGAFLSGGVDSSLIAAMMQERSAGKVKTFTVGFDDAGFDEAPFARAVAKHLGTDHHELRVSPEMARAVIPALTAMYDEPFADSSQIPTHLVSCAAREQVTVALTGDAGDELFGGYNRYFWGPRIWNRLSWLPYTARRALGGAMGAVPPRAWDSLAGPLSIVRAGEKAHKLAARLRVVRTLDDLYWSLVSELPDSSSLLVNPPSFFPSANEVRDRLKIPSQLDPISRMMFCDTMTYLPDDILCKVDRAAMACGLETRVPYLDHRVLELAWRMSLDLKIRGKTSKWVLREVLYRRVPRDLIERPKAGFGIPVGEWLRGPLRDWAEALLDVSRLRREGIFHHEPIRLLWREHQSRRHDWTARLWTLLMFQAWLEK